MTVGLEAWKKESSNQWSELNAAKVLSEIFDEVHELKLSLDSEILAIGIGNIEAIIVEGLELVSDLYQTADEEFNKNVPWITKTFMNGALATPSSDAKLFKRVNEFIEYLDFTRASLSAMVTKIKTGENTVWEISD